MPTEEKEHKHHHKIKPVIEEIVDDQPMDVTSQETHMETVEESRQIDHPVHTYPTNDENLAVKDTSGGSKKGFSINFSFLFITVAVALFVAILSGALYVYFNGVNSIKGNTTPSPTPYYPETTPVAYPCVSPIATVVPSASPTSQVKLSNLKVSILNGSGKIGEAGKAKTLLEKAGFKVSRTGNADSFNYPETLIQVKAGTSPDVVSKAQEALSGTYQVKVGDALDAKSGYDLIITIGAK